MKPIEKTLTSTYNVYEAFDGTTFNSIDECKIYESSATGILLGRLEKYKINSTDEESLFGFGSSEGQVRVYKLTDTKSKETLEQLWNIIYPYRQMPKINIYVLVHLYFNNTLESMFIQDVEELFGRVFDDKYNIYIEEKARTINKHIENANDLNLFDEI